MSASRQVIGSGLPTPIIGRKGQGIRMRQRGSMAVTMMLMLVGLVAMLGLIEIGYLYWARRDTQKVVDLAALAGAQKLTACAADNSSNSAALGNAMTDNGFTGTLLIACGHWDTTQPGDQHFVPVTSTLPLNAVRVQATLPLTPFFGFAHFSNISTTAIAVPKGPPIAAFSVGSSTAGIAPASPLGTLLNSALGSSLGLQLLSYSGIANADISLLNIVKALPIDVGTVDGVLSSEMTVKQFLTAYVQVLTQTAGDAGVDLTFVNQQVALIEAQIGDVQINLGDVLNVDVNTQDPNIALNTNINALDILSAVLMAADSANGLALPSTSIGIPGVATVSLGMSIVEPPQIGVGGVGTVAHTSQIRLALNVSAVGSPAPGQSLIGLPVYLEVAPTDATLTALECNVPGSGGGNTDLVTITTSPGLVNAYIGLLTSSAFTNIHQTWPTLISSGALAPLLDIALGPLQLVRLALSANVQLAANPASSTTFSVDPTTPVSQQANMTRSVGNSSLTLTSLVTSLLSSSTLQTQVTLAGAPFTLLPVAPVLNTLSLALAPVLNVVDSALVTPLLQVLGIQLGTAQVNLRSVNCDTSPQLVY